MSTASPYPTRSRAAHLDWRSDGDSQVGGTDVSLRARPDDKGFKVGVFYFSIYAYETAVYSVTCSVSALSRTATVKLGGRYGGTVGLHRCV